MALDNALRGVVHFAAMGDGGAFGDLARELDELETLRAAHLAVTRDACDWPELRRAILAQGGIGPSRDWERDWYPADLYRVHGKAPDLIAAETYLGGARVPPWSSPDDGNGTPSDSAMFAYVRASYEQWQAYQRAQAEHVKRRPAPVVPARVASSKVSDGRRSYAELVADLQRKHGADVDLSGLLASYVAVYESGERIDVEIDGRAYRGTIGATRGSRPRFVLLTSLQLPEKRTA